MPRIGPRPIPKRVCSRRTVEPEAEASEEIFGWMEMSAGGAIRCAGLGGPRYRSRIWRDHSPRLWFAKQRERILQRLHT